MGFDGMAGITKIIPDIVTYGKIIGGGMPVGAIAGKKDVMQFLAPVGPVYQAGTLSGNPVAMVAGLTSLKKLTPDAYVKLELNTKAVVNTMAEWMKAKGFEDYQTIQYGSLFYPISTHDKLNNITQLPKNMNERFFSLFKTMLDKGIYLAPNAYEVAFGSLAHDAKVIEDLKNRLWN
jgi:glutamate-1-semialdehyde 2,1-aminomutase